MRAGIFMLDLISNALGAMLLLYFLAVPRRFETLPLAMKESLWLEVELSAPTAQIDLILTWPDGSQRHCHPGDRPEFEPVTENLDPARVAARVGGHPDSQPSNSCTILLIDPKPGRWSWSANVFNGEAPLGSQWTVEAWMSGRSVVGSPLRLERKQLQDISGTLEIPEVGSGHEPNLEVSP